MNFYDLDFDEPEELENEKIAEKNLCPVLKDLGFIFTNDSALSGAAYIMPDGKFLYIEQNRKILDIEGKATHGALDYYLIKNNIIQDTKATRVLCQSDNAIRINDGSNFSYEVLIALPKYKITIEQEESLEKWLNALIEKNKYTVSVGNKIVSEIFQKYNLINTDPEKVVEKIHNYYFNGILREAKDIKRKGK